MPENTETKTMGDLLKEKYGPDHFRKLGAKGGKKSRGGGFTGRPDLASRASKISWANQKAREAKNV